MNNRFVNTLILISAAAAFLAGCGPQDINEAGYATQAADGSVYGDELNQGPQAMGPDGAQDQAGGDQQGGPQDMDNQGMGGPQAGGPQAGGPQGGCPTGGCPVGPRGGDCPTGQCEIPPDPDTHRAVQLPDQTQMQDTKIIPTNEQQLATDTVDYRTTKHVWQPSERHHTVHKHRNLIRRHFTKVVYHPTFKRINRVVNTSSQQDQVMPTEEEVAPAIDYGCVGAPQPQPASVAVVRPVVRRIIRLVPRYRPYLSSTHFPHLL